MGMSRLSPNGDSSCLNRGTVGSIALRGGERIRLYEPLSALSRRNKVIYPTIRPNSRRRTFPGSETPDSPPESLGRKQTIWVRFIGRFMGTS